VITSVLMVERITVDVWPVFQGKFHCLLLNNSNMLMPFYMTPRKVNLLEWRLFILPKLSFVLP
jgi:hypothetical protein